MEEVISVIVPIFNSSRTIHRCIDSILAQTYQSLEILLIDDGSFDDSGSIVDEYAIKDTRVKVFHKENGGLSSARNYGLERATGKWISFIDSDDWIEAVAYETILSNGTDPDLYVFGRSTDTPARKRKSSPEGTVVSIGNEEALKRLIINNSIGNAVWDKLYSKDLFDGIRFPDGFNYEDARITHQLLRKANRIVLIPDVLYHSIRYSGDRPSG